MSITAVDSRCVILREQRGERKRERERERERERGAGVGKTERGGRRSDGGREGGRWGGKGGNERGRVVVICSFRHNLVLYLPISHFTNSDRFATYCESQLNSVQI